MHSAGSKVWRRRLRQLGRPAFAEIVCAGLALLCLAAPTWWTLNESRSDRLVELDRWLGGSASTAVDGLEAWVRRAEFEAQAATQTTEIGSAGLRLLENPDSAEAAERFRAAARSALDAFVEAPADQVWLIASDGQVRWPLAETASLTSSPPASTGRWYEANGADAGAPAEPLAISVRLASPVAQGRLVYRIATATIVQNALQSALASGADGAYAIDAREGHWLSREVQRSSHPCGVSAEQFVAGVRAAGEKQLLREFDGCAGSSYGAIAEAPTLGILVAVETNAAAAMKVLRTGRMAAIALVALLGVLVLILMLLQTTDSGVEGVEVGGRRKNASAWGILAVSLIATGVAGVVSNLRYERYQAEQVAGAVQQLARELDGRVAGYSQVLEASAAAYRHGSDDEGHWRKFTESLNLSHRFPGFLCVSLVLAPTKEAPANSPDGAVRLVGTVEPNEGGCPPSELPAATVTRLSELAQRAYRARTLSAGRLRLRAAGEERGLVAMSQPILPATATQAPGWVFALVDPGVLFAGAADHLEPDLDFALFEGDQAVDDAIAFDSSAGRLLADPSRAEEQVAMGGTSWTVAAAPSQSISIPFEENYPFQVVLAGLAISVLLFDIALVLSSTRARALGIAALMTARFRDSEERIRAVIDHASDGIVAFDSDGRISTYNPGAEKLFGYTKEEIVGLRIDDLIPGWDSVSAARLSESSPDVATECVGMSKEGRSFPAELTVSRMQRVEGPDAFSAIVRDITARKLTEEKLRESEERYALASRGANDGLWDWNLKTNEVYYSSRWKEIIGVDGSEIGSAPEEWFSRVHPSDVGALRRTLDEHLEGKSSFFESEHRVRHSTGDYRWVLSRAVAVRDKDGRASRLAGSQTDVTNRKRAERKLRHDALHDQLTGLPNRTFFMNKLEHARESAAENAPALFGLLFLDVDRFKVVNDSLGHLIGDQLLVAISGRLKGCVRPGDTVCRLGGDEFAVLVEKIGGVEDATRLAERIQEKLQEPLRVNGHEVYAAVSIGIALSSDGRRTAEEMLRDADIAMYRAKSQGRGRYELFDRRMHAHAVEVLQIETDLRRAVERKELVLHYQPILDLAEGRVLSCEALLRWNHPSRGLVYPGQFVSIAEETGVIGDISCWLLEEACRQNRAWRDAGLPEICVSVNISPRQFLHQDVGELVDRCLRESRLEPSSLQLELTEGALLESSETSRKPLNYLYQKGVHISLDDFGTGYSSLVYLRRFPIHNIKIDQSFVKRVPADSGDVAVVSGLIGLAHTLGLRVIAEGVETTAQLEFLRENNCDAVQGYLLGRPKDADAFAEVLKEGSHPVASSLRDLQATMPFD